MCIVAAKYFDNVGWVGVKNRDRNYKPLIKIKQSFRNGIERLYLLDDKTYYTEGLNEYGVSILSAAVQVKHDEKEGFLNKNKKSRTQNSSDGKKVRTALFEKTLEKALNKLIELELPGNTIIFNKEECYILEGDFKESERKEFYYKFKKIPKNEVVVRTNHGMLIKSGYSPDSDNPDVVKSYKSSLSRYNKTVELLKNVNTPMDMLIPISDQSNSNNQLNPLRASKQHNKSILVTTGQIMLTPEQLTLHYKPLWCDIDIENFSKINNVETKCFYEIISSKKLLSFKEYIEIK